MELSIEYVLILKSNILNRDLWEAMYCCWSVGVGGCWLGFALCPGGTHGGAKQQASGQTSLSPEMESPANCVD